MQDKKDPEQAFQIIVALPASMSRKTLVYSQHHGVGGVCGAGRGIKFKSNFLLQPVKKQVAFRTRQHQTDFKPSVSNGCSHVTELTWSDKHHSWKILEISKKLLIEIVLSELCCPVVCNRNWNKTNMYNIPVIVNTGHDCSEQLRTFMDKWYIWMIFSSLPKQKKQTS